MHQGGLVGRGQQKARQLFPSSLGRKDKLPHGFKKVPVHGLSAIVLFIVGGACTIGWLITMADVPAQLIARMEVLVERPISLMIVLNLLFLMLGMVMDITPIILIFAPVVFPLIRAAGIDQYYFSLIMIINLCIGLITPPVGTVLFVGCSVSSLKMGEVVRGILPFLLAETAFLIICICFPQIITYPATWFGYN